MKNRFFLFLLISVLLVATVQAQETLTEQIPSFQFDKEFDLQRGCFNNGFFCGTDFICNISLFHADGNVVLNNTVMTNQGSFRNVTITQAQNDQLGFIKAIESCNNVTLAGGDTFLIAITGDGKPFRQFPQQFFLIFLAITITLIGFSTDRLRILKHGGAMFMIVMGVITLYPGYAFINWSTLTGQAMGFVLIGLGFYFLVEDSFSRNKQEDNYESESQFSDGFDE